MMRSLLESSEGIGRAAFVNRTEDEMRGKICYTKYKFQFINAIYIIAYRNIHKKLELETYNLKQNKKIIININNKINKLIIIK